MPTILLVAAHIVVTIVLNVSPLYLRLASVIIPVPFGFLTYPLHKIGFRGALALGVAVAVLSVMCMLTVTGVNDGVPMCLRHQANGARCSNTTPVSLCGFGSGSILGLMVFQVLPLILSQGGKPNAAAFRIARLLGQHVGEEQLRRRARLI